MGAARGPTLFSDPLWRIAVAAWLGMEAPAGHSDCAQHTAHPQGLSRLGCKHANAPRIQRHEALAVQLVQCASQAGIKCQREVRLTEASRERPGDIRFLLPGRSLLADVTVTSPANLAARHQHPLAPAAAAFDLKIAKYASQLQAGRARRFSCLRRRREW